MEFLGLAIFTLFFIAAALQLDNPEVPSKPDTRKSMEELHADDEARYGNPTLKQIALPIYIAENKQRYLASPEWSIKRRNTLKRDNYTCQQCRDTGIPLEVHHITYCRFEEELYSDLVSVCRKCHQAIHDKYGYNYLNEFPLIK